MTPAAANFAAATAGVLDTGGNFPPVVDTGGKFAAAGIALTINISSKVTLKLNIVICHWMYFRKKSFFARRNNIQFTRAKRKVIAGWLQVLEQLHGA
jgi:hypothetical protein